MEEEAQKMREKNLRIELETAVEKVLEQQLPNRYEDEVRAVTEAMAKLASDPKAPAEARVNAARAVYSSQNDGYIFYFKRCELIASWFNAKDKHDAMHKMADSIGDMASEHKRRSRPSWMNDDDEE